ncbi:hypothetical protein ACIRD6_29705 [Streptomyces sp. NPDC102473]|uniref:hypothetical protein n=1 Tax=Streptomyces sp. NPDC102473 TaxID=3366180 RepID=UPI003806E22D
MSTVPPEVTAFVTQASRLTAAVLDEIRYATAVAVASDHYDPSTVPTLSASEFSTLKKQVRDAFAARAEELRSGRSGGLRAANSCTTLTAQAIWRRDTLTADQYVSLTEVFVAHGVTLPGRDL